MKYIVRKFVLEKNTV